MNRKDFIVKGSLFAFALSTSISCKTSKNDKLNNRKQTTKCDISTDDILGPFYRKNAPERTNIREKSDVMDLLIVKGKVILNDCKTPLKNQLIDFWQANRDGEYDNDTDKYSYRAKVKTNEKGEYELKTIIPGRYLNGTQFRPSHIHLRIQTETTEELISQIYFKNDPYIKKDPWASSSKAQNRILTLVNVSNKEKEVTFDIILDKK